MSKWIELTQDMAVEMAEIIVNHWEEWPVCDLYYNINTGEFVPVYSGEEDYYKHCEGWRIAITDANKAETWGDESDAPEEGVISDLIWGWRDQIERSINGEAD